MAQEQHLLILERQVQVISELTGEVFQQLERYGIPRALEKTLQEHGGLQVTDLKSTRITRPMKLTRFKEFLPEKQKYDKKKQPQPGKK